MRRWEKSAGLISTEAPAKPPRNWPWLSRHRKSLRGPKTTKPYSSIRQTRRAIFKKPTPTLPRLIWQIQTRWDIGPPGEEFRRLEALESNNVRPDDGRKLDLHRYPGNRPGPYEPSPRRTKTLRNKSSGQTRRLRRHGRDGRRTTLGGHHERRRFLGIDVNPERIDRRVKSRYCDRQTDSLSQALAWLTQSQKELRPLSVGLVGNCAEILPELVTQQIVPDLLTDQTSAP